MYEQLILSSIFLAISVKFDGCKTLLVLLRPFLHLSGWRTFSLQVFRAIFYGSEFPINHLFKLIR